MYRYVHSSLIGQDPIDYLEFGVFQGESIRYWVNLHTHPDSNFVGFDSFQGLPDQWGTHKKGAFDLGGATPQINDSRVQFIKGWFDNTIPPFAREFKPKNRPVLHLDADLYGSTMLALVQLGPSLAKGSLLFFDEFFARDHEFRALMDWQAIYHRSFRVVAETGDYAQICAELL
jgi:O-methyltransferase